MRQIVVLLSLLLLAPAAAQPGPAPGYAWAADYAMEYAEGQGENASADPVGYAESKASQEAVQAEISHAAYMACWAADDAGVQHETCDAYYTPRGQENPDQPPCECNASTDGVEQYSNETLNGTAAYAGNATDFVNSTLEDPQNATTYAAGFAAASIVFAGSAAQGAVMLVVGIVEGILFCLGLGGQIIVGAGQSIGALFDVLDDTVALAVSSAGNALSLVGGLLASIGIGVGTAASGLGGAIGSAAGAVASGLGAAASAVGSGISAAVAGTGSLLATIGKGIGVGAVATLDGLGSAASAVGEAIGDAASAIGDAISGIFDGSDKPDATGDAVDDAIDGATEKKGLLGGIKDLLF